MLAVCVNCLPLVSEVGVNQMVRNIFQFRNKFRRPSGIVEALFLYFHTFCLQQRFRSMLCPRKLVLIKIGMADGQQHTTQSMLLVRTH